MIDETTPEVGFRRRLIEARDDRAARVAQSCAPLPATAAALVQVSVNAPGWRKHDPLLDPVFAAGRAAVLHTLHGSLLILEGRDALGPWALVTCADAPRTAKARMVALEEGVPTGRLLDIDVFGPDGVQVDRRSLALPPRRCFVCDEPAADCIRLQRHAAPEVAEAVIRMAGTEARPHWVPAGTEAGRYCTPTEAGRYCGPLPAGTEAGRYCGGVRVAAALVRAARAELDLTPKPGLVDRRDNGSHPDLTYELMSRSIDLLPRYYDDLVEAASAGPPHSVWTGPPDAASARPPHAGLDIDNCIAAARRAEARMVAAVGANTHRGYIFLSGLVLLASVARGAVGRTALRQAIADIAAAVLAPGRRGLVATNGAELRRRCGIGGIEAEALAGLPSVFGSGLPALARARTAGFAGDRAAHHVMATLMTVVEDTTALHRCGPEGLDRLRRDGRQLLVAMERGDDYLPALSSLNDEYRSLRLTMGGVADCLALTIALDETLEEDA